MSSDEVSITEAKARLEECCRNIEAELETLQAQLSQARTRTLSGQSHTETDAAVLQEKERMLTARIEQLNAGLNDTSDILPSDSPVLREMLLEELASDEEQLEQTLAMMQSQRSDLRQQIETETEVKHEFERLRDLHDEQLANVENVPSTDVSSSQSQALATAAAKYSQLNKQYKTRLRQMVEFVQKYFPPVTDEDVKKFNKTHGKSAASVDARSYLPLQIVIQNLMEKCLDTPNDPYIDIDDTLWPPYVEMMLRSGIVLRHPTDVHRIRMTPYHI